MNGTSESEGKYCSYCQTVGHFHYQCALAKLDEMVFKLQRVNVQNKELMSAYEQAAQAPMPYPGDCALDHSYFSDCPTVHPDVSWGSFWSTEQAQSGYDYTDMQGPEGWYSGYDEEC